MTFKPNVHQRLHAVMTAVDYVQKERKQGMRYTVVSHDAVTAKVRPELVKQGVIYYPVEMQASQEGNRTQVQLKVRFANIDEPADFIDVCGLGYGVDDQDKGPGKAISYAVKYCLLKALGLETGDDPDLDDQPAKPAARPTASAAPPRTTEPPRDDWQIIGNDLVAAVKLLRTPKAVNTYLATHAADFLRLETGAPAEYLRVKAAIVSHRDLLPAMVP